MPGRTLLDENNVPPRYRHPTLKRRRTILRETLARFDGKQAHHRSIAAENLARWSEASEQTVSLDDPMEVEVIAGDWGDTTLTLTKRWGRAFAALNMANAFCPGGAYIEGTSAQEENMWRRSDCHFFVKDEDMDERQLYKPAMVELIAGQHGRVYLDVDTPRVCIRGSEDRASEDLGYPWLEQSDFFPFYELRAAAQDWRTRQHEPFDEVEARKRIQATLDTLVDAKQRFVVLSAHGCGAFCNPPETIARIYQEELQARSAHFRMVAFAIFFAGVGEKNFEVFERVFATG